ncbi:DUF805 domain-containing protein [Arenivirga flava]|uniref:DUF805 domain-containing protein n=1 Tax=Arenivirga flava TaxID=1930060 RepID=A0AA37UFT8_9MICO|nr:DUF805 domain-containing protein [Arenivirga flava]GMA29793.1 hypothetical protein GCM10025874_30460 [Arenivirga flava]
MTEPTASPTTPALAVRRAGPLTAIRLFYTRYATFSGTASRSEYWWAALFLVLAIFGPILLAGPLTALSPSVDGSMPVPVAVALVVTAVVVLGSLIPSIAIGARRMQDAGFSGWLVLIQLVPYLGSLVFLILAILPPSRQSLART